MSDILDRIASHPRVARFICRKLVRHFAGDVAPAPLVDLADFTAAQDACERVFCHDTLVDRVLELARETRTHRGVSLGVSPRGALHLLKAAKALAVVRGRSFVTDGDVIDIAPAALAHRLKLRDPRLRAETLIRETCIEKFERAGRS